MGSHTQSTVLDVNQVFDANSYSRVLAKMPRKMQAEIVVAEEIFLFSAVAVSEGQLGLFKEAGDCESDEFFAVA